MEGCSVDDPRASQVAVASIAAESPEGLASSVHDSISSTLEFMLIVGRLKANKRTGWVLRGVPGPESIADHMYRMAILSFLLPENTGLRRDHCIKLSLVHDLAESLVGDITPLCGVSKAEKHRREEDAMLRLRSLLLAQHSSVAEEMYQLYVRDCDGCVLGLNSGGWKDGGLGNE